MKTKKLIITSIVVAAALTLVVYLVSVFEKEEPMVEKTQIYLEYEDRFGFSERVYIRDLVEKITELENRVVNLEGYKEKRICNDNGGEYLGTKPNWGHLTSPSFYYLDLSLCVIGKTEYKLKDGVWTNEETKTLN